MSSDRCDACPVGSAACLGVADPHQCELLRRGEPGQADLLRRLAGLPPQPPIPIPHPPREGPVRACILGPVLYVGGAERWAATLVRYGDPARVRWLGVGCTHAEGTAPAMVAEFEALGCHAAIGLAACARLAIQSELVVSWGLPDIASYFGPRGMRPRHVATSHGDGRSDWTRMAMDAACPIADAVVAVSRVALEPIPEPWRSGAVVIDNGVDRRRLVPRIPRAAQRAAWGVPEGAKVLGYLGRLADDKDPQALARAMAHMPAEWVGVAVGDGIHARKVIEHAGRTAPGRVIFAGADLDVGSAYRAIDVMLCPSPTEGFGLTAGECLAGGVPVVGTRVGMLDDDPDLIRLIPFDADGETIAAAVLADQSDPEGTRERCRRARKVARERYGAECFARRWDDLLWSLARADANVPVVALAGRR